MYGSNITSVEIPDEWTNCKGPRMYDDKDEHEFFDEPEETIQPKDVIEAMQQLSPAYQMVFNLYVMENYSHQEIADELGISVGTSKSNLAKSRMNMRKILSKKFADRI